jgi:4a-hydroxytetrahydrobiopterin dehydratase
MELTTAPIESAVQAIFVIPDHDTLANKHCLKRPKRLDLASLTQQLPHSLPQWKLLLDDDEQTPKALERRFKFSDFHKASRAAQALWPMIHREDHHPVLTLSFDQLIVIWNTHTVAGVSMNDLICAAKCDAIIKDQIQPDVLPAIESAAPTTKTPIESTDESTDESMAQSASDDSAQESAAP